MCSQTIVLDLRMITMMEYLNDWSLVEVGFKWIEKRNNQSSLLIS